MVLDFDMVFFALLGHVYLVCMTVVDKNHPSIIEINKNKKRYT
jgi:hypothetical protein